MDSKQSASRSLQTEPIISEGCKLIDTRPQPPRQHSEEPRSTLYNALDPARTQIRVLQIHAADDIMAAARCSMKTISLDEGIQYNALSYEWGDPQGEEVRSWEGQTAIINDMEVKITTNLHAALIYVRRHMSVTTMVAPDSCFWIDVVCVNQEDLSERGQQVSLMEKVYSRAHYVLLWVGVDRNESEMAIDFIKEACLERGRLGDKIPSDWYVQRLTNSEYQGHWIAVCHLLRRSFWRRSWIIQEIVLARHPVLHCGNSAVMATATFTFVADLVQLMSTSTDYGRRPDILSRVLLAIREVYHICECRKNYEEDLLPQRSLLHLLEKLSWTLVTDPRDKAYSLLGIARPYDGARLSIDYHVSSAQVFKNTAAYIIEGTRNLDILTEASLTNPSLPTWVPDWADPESINPLIAGTNKAVVEMVNRSGLFCAGGPTYLTATLSESNSVLTLDAIMVSTIRQLTSTRSSPQSNPNEPPFSFPEVVEDLNNVMSFLSADYHHILSTEVHVESAEDSDNRSDNSMLETFETADATSRGRRLTALLQADLARLYIDLSATSTYLSQILTTLPCKDFIEFSLKCLTGKATLTTCTPDQLSMIWITLSNGGIGRRLFKCGLPDQFLRNRGAGAALTDEDPAFRRDGSGPVPSRPLVMRTLGLARGQVEVGDTVAVLPGCKSPMILRRVKRSGEDEYYQLIGEAYCDKLKDWESLPPLPVTKISLV